MDSDRGARGRRSHRHGAAWALLDRARPEILRSPPSSRRRYGYALCDGIGRALVGNAAQERASGPRPALVQRLLAHVLVLGVLLRRVFGRPGSADFTSPTRMARYISGRPACLTYPLVRGGAGAGLAVFAGTAGDGSRYQLERAIGRFPSPVSLSRVDAGNLL
jgi:hypothetical protein